MVRFVSAFALTAILLCSAGQGSYAQSTPAEIVKARQDGMEKMWPDFYKAMALTIRSGNPDLALVAAKAAPASEHVKKVSQLFPPGTGRDVVPTTRAKPEVWTQRADFEGALTTLIGATNALGEAAKSGDVEKVKTDWAVVAKACGGCHGGPKKSDGKFRFEEG